MKYPLKSDEYDVDVFNDNFKEVTSNIESNYMQTLQNFAKKANTTDVNNLENTMYDELDGKADTAHTHSADDIRAGILPIERGGTGASNATDVVKNLGLGTSIFKDYDTTIDKNSDNLITSKVVYNEIFNKRLIYSIALSTSANNFKEKANFIIDTNKNVAEQIIGRLKYIDEQVTNDKNLRGITILFMPGTYKIETDLELTDYSNFKFEGFAGNTTFNISSETKIIINNTVSKFYNIEFNNIMFTKDECSYDIADCIFYFNNINSVRFKECSFALTGNVDNVEGQAMVHCDGTTANLTIVGGSMSGNLENCTNSYMVDLVGTRNNTLSIMLGEVRSSKHISVNFPKHNAGKGTTTYCKWGLWAIDEYTEGVMN